jgi:predicted phosphodiesterase
MRGTKAVLSAIIALFVAALGCQQASAGRVAGRVFIDTNGDGVFDATDRPAAAVSVTDGFNVVRTDGAGLYAIDAGVQPPLGESSYPIVSVSFPSGAWPKDGWFRRIVSGVDANKVDFPLVSQDQPETFIFIHGTDSHLPRGGTDKFAEFIKEVGQIGEAVAFCVLTGDDPDLSDHRPFDKAQEEWKLVNDMFHSITRPLFVVPGNHDAAGTTTTGWDQDNPMFGYGFFRRFLGPIRWSFNYGGVHFAGVDFLHIQGKKWVWGVGDQAAQWLDRDLALVPPGMRKVVFVHHPLGEEFAKVVRKHNVDQIYAGHTHRVTVETFQGADLFGSASVGNIFGDKPGPQPGYRIVRVEPRAIRSVYKATGKDFAIEIQSPPTSGRLAEGAAVRGTFYDPGKKVRSIAVTLDGKPARVTITKGMQFSSFEAVPDAEAMPTGPCKLEVVIRSDSIDRRIIRDITVDGEDTPAPAGKPLPASAPAR